MFLKIFKSAFTPIISTCFLMFGCGLINTVINLRINDNTYDSSLIVGVITSVYYLGMFIGAFGVSSMIFRVGHMRAYAAFASGFVVSIIAPMLDENIYFLSAMRLLSGYCIGALYVTIESWLLSLSGENDRGKYLSFYMIALFGGTSVSQLLLKYMDYNSMYPFCVAAIFTSLSVIPVSLVNTKTSTYEKSSALSFFDVFKISPTGSIGCVVSGMFSAAAYGLIPIYYDDLNYAEAEIGNFMAVTIVGGMVLQYPLGILSDHYDRRKVLLGICSVVILVSLAILTQRLSGISTNISIVTLLFLFGGLAFSIYPISISHACDLIKQDDLVQATQALLLSYGIGSVIGPIFSSLLMKFFGPSGLFASFVIYALLLSIFFSYRIFFGSIPKPQDEQNFVAVPTTTPVTTELDPRT
ncbi:MAG: MFS transporter [Rickettsiales bacterium]